MSPSKDSLTHFRSLSLFDGDLHIQAISAPNARCQGEAVPITNRLSQVDLPNGMHTKYTYDASGRQDSIHHKDGATVKQGFDYTFDDGGNITRIDHEDGSYWEYDYDGRDRLVEAERYDNTPTLLHRYTYTYDDGDNMATKAVYDPTGPTTVTTTFTYNDGNELTNTNDGTNSIDMTYDEWGRLTEKDDGAHTATYAYRYGSKLYSVTSNFPGEGNVTYEYGANLKLRAISSAGSGTIWYNWGRFQTLISEETSVVGAGDGTLSNTRIGTLAQVQGADPNSGNYAYYLKDRVRSVRLVADSSKATIANAEFTPFGESYASSGSGPLTQRFTGHDWDSNSGSYITQYRRYFPAKGRWSTRDPLGMKDGINRYIYVKNRPTEFRDPFGLYAVSSRCCDKEKKEIDSAAARACSKVDAQINDPELAECIKKRCNSNNRNKVKCKKCKKPKQYGYNILHLPRITLCTNNIPAGCTGAVLIHEWAHSCRWNHSKEDQDDGTGVPGNDGYTTCATEGPRW